MSNYGRKQYPFLDLLDQDDDNGNPKNPASTGRNLPVLDRT
jgi:hypothetical protein